MRKNGAKLCGTWVSSFLSHRIVKSLTFMITVNRHFNVLDLVSQITPFCPGSIRDTFIISPPISHHQISQTYGAGSFNGYFRSFQKKISFTLPYHRRELLPNPSVPCSLLQSESHKKRCVLQNRIFICQGLCFGCGLGGLRSTQENYTNGMGRSSSLLATGSVRNPPTNFE